MVYHNKCKATQLIKSKLGRVAANSCISQKGHHLMHKKTDILGLSISNVTMKFVLSSILEWSDCSILRVVYTPNAEIVMQSVREPELAAILNQADFLLPDGAGVVLGARILGTPLAEKVSGVDVARGLVSAKKKPALRFYLFGGKQGVAELAALHLLHEYPFIEIAGYRNGYFDPAENENIVNEINKTNADVLFVCLGAPRQEEWIHAHRSILNCKIAIGLGGSLDVFAGVGKLAPEWIRKTGFEWLYRLVREPRRWKRMLDLPRFIIAIVRLRLRTLLH